MGCYRPPSQGTIIANYFTDNLNALMSANQCTNVIIAGDLNQRGIQNSFNSFLDVFNLRNHVTFSIHQSGSSLDPVVTDFPPDEVQCSSQGPASSSDHEAIITRITFKTPLDGNSTRTLWVWDDADWAGLLRCLAQQNWEELLKGDVNEQVE